MKSIKNHFAKNINTKNNTPQQGRFVDKTSGFTIIEVALVLAIAGLIFLVVFLALPALQNSQKDTAAKQDVGRVVSEIQEYYSDGGSVPITNTTPISFSTNNLSVAKGIWSYRYPDSSTYISPGGNQAIDYHVGKKCNGSPNSSGNIPLADSDPADVAVGIRLSSGQVYCLTATD